VRIDWVYREGREKGEGEKRRYSRDRRVGVCGVYVQRDCVVSMCVT
jgi:hypothetical protein